MSFQPVIPLSGLGGWSFLQRTKERQEASFSQTPLLQRDTAYFRETIGKITTAEELVNDRRLLRVAIGAFGLQDALDSRALLRQVIEGGTEDPRSLANRFSDKRFLSLAKGFAHLAKGAAPASAPRDLVDKVITAYTQREFQIAVGNQNETMRFALALQSDLPELVESYGSDRARWFALLGNPPLRKVLETTLGLPKEFGMLDIDEQLKRMTRLVQNRFGTSDLKEIANSGVLEDLTKRFMIMSQLQEMQSGLSSANVALQLLQSIQR